MPRMMSMQVAFKCPFCGLSCVGGDLAGPGEGPVPGVAHTRPTCEHFDELDADEFLYAVNDATVPAADLARLRADLGVPPR